MTITSGRGPGHSLPPCDYRFQFSKLTTHYFCRHPRVHAPHGFVNQAVCGNCQLHDAGGESPRPVPDRLVYPPGLPQFDQSLRYISHATLVHDVSEFTSRLPADISAVAGLPRSGILPAALIATARHIPLLALTVDDGLICLGSGGRLRRPVELSGRLLIIDDSVHSGEALARARRALAECSWPGEVLWAAMYPLPSTCHLVDLYARVAPEPHLFEWNLFNCNLTRNFAFDFDGVLCQDWSGGNEEGREYQEFLDNAAPRWLPRRSPIPLIVTARLEMHRESTTRWLDRHGVAVERLVMGPWKSVSERRQVYDAGQHKGDAYLNSACWLFIESDAEQARQIFEYARKPVLCPASGVIFQEDE